MECAGRNTRQGHDGEIRHQGLVDIPFLVQFEDPPLYGVAILILEMFDFSFNLPLKTSEAGV
jgi:hypothetical protein